MLSLTLAVPLLALAVPTQRSDVTGVVPVGIRMIDLNGDGLVDLLRLGTDGTISVSLNQGRRQFEDIVQDLPRVLVSDVFVDDLNGDGLTDLYLVSTQANVALAGDGTGRLVDATSELGLNDAGVGVGVERFDMDADGLGDLLLHNADGDVVFWGTREGTFERDRGSPPVGGSSIVPGAPTWNVPPGLTPWNGTLSGTARIGALFGPPSAFGPLPMVAPPTVFGPPIVTTSTARPFCAETLEDVTTGNCIQADSTPTLGRLYPLGPEWNIDALGNVGIGTVSPGARLEVAGQVKVTGGAPGVGKVLTSDATGLATWQTPVSPVGDVVGIVYADFDDGTINANTWTVSTTGTGTVLNLTNRMILTTAGGCASATVQGAAQVSLASGKVILRMRVSAYQDGGGIYGNAQPRGLVFGSDRNNAIEFISSSRTSVQARTVANGVATTTDFALGQTVQVPALYQIVATSSVVKFYVDGALIATHATNIPTTTLNPYWSTSDGCAGSVPLWIDDVSLERVE